MGDSNPEPINLTRNIANFNIGGNYEVKKAAPLDNRMRTPYRNDLISNNWVTYKGMICEVTDDSDYRGLYELVDKDSTNMNNWRKVTSYRPSKHLLINNSNNAVQDVGGFSLGANWFPADLNNFTYDQLFDILLFPTQPSIKIDPSINISFSNLSRNSLETNTDVSFTMSVSLQDNTNKVTLVGKGLTGPDTSYAYYTGDISSVYYIDFCGNQYDLSFNSDTIFDISFEHTILGGDQSLNVYVTYHDGSFQPYNTKGMYDNSYSDYDNNDEQYRGPSGEYLSKTHIGTYMIKGLYPTYYWTGSRWTFLSIIYDYDDTIDFELKWPTIPEGDPSANPFKFAISKEKFDYYYDNSINYQIEEQTVGGGPFTTTNCKFYNSASDLSYNDESIRVGGQDISYVAFKTQYTASFGSYIQAIKYRFVVL